MNSLYVRLARLGALVVLLGMVASCSNKTLDWEPGLPTGGNDGGGNNNGGGGPIVRTPAPITQGELVGSWVGSYTTFLNEGTDSASSVIRTIEFRFTDTSYIWTKSLKPKNGKGGYTLKRDSLVLDSDYPYRWLYDASMYPEAPSYTHLYLNDTLRLRWTSNVTNIRKEALLVRKGTPVPIASD